MPSLTANARAAALVEVILVVATSSAFHAVLRHLGAGVAGASVGTLLAAALASWLLHRRVQSWRDVGWRRPEHIPTAAIWTLGLALVALAFVPLVAQIASNILHLPPQDLSAFADLPNQPVRYLILLVPVGWGVAAFGEELIYRGFIDRRLADACGGTRSADLAALLGQATLFGLGHAYLGARGMLNAALLGLVSGIAYRLNGRNLWPLIIAHGIVDTVGITVLYLGLGHG
jgi:uncharacterized protein